MKFRFGVAAADMVMSLRGASVALAELWTGVAAAAELDLRAQNDFVAVQAEEKAQGFVYINLHETIIQQGVTKVKLKLTVDESKALKAYLENSEDCEKLSEKEWILDIYDNDTPISLDLVFNRDSIFADGAEYLKYDAEMDGWFMSGPIDTAETVLSILRAAGVI
jgi:hypothetical protein